MVSLLNRHPAFAKAMLERNHPFTAADLRNYSEILNWANVSSNGNIDFTEALIDRHLDLVDFSCLASNPAVPWTLGLLLKHEARLDWDSSKPALWEKVFKDYGRELLRWV